MAGIFSAYNLIISRFNIFILPVTILPTNLTKKNDKKKKKTSRFFMFSATGLAHDNAQHTVFPNALATTTAGS